MSKEEYEKICEDSEMSEEKFVTEAIGRMETQIDTRKKMDKEKVKEIANWARYNCCRLNFPSIYDDGSGIVNMRTTGCGCCSTYINEEIPDINDLELTIEDQNFIVKEAIKGLIESYGFKIEDFVGGK